MRRPLGLDPQMLSGNTGTETRHAIRGISSLSTFLHAGALASFIS